MKRLTAILLTMLMLLLPACAEGDASHDWYLKTGLALALDMCELANDGAYISLMSGRTLSVLDSVPENTDSFGEVWLAKPLLSAETMVKLMGGEPPCETGVEQLSAKMPSMFLTRFNATYSAEAVAAASLATAMRTFVQPSGGFEPCILAVELGDVMAGVAFSKTGDDTVTVICQPIFLEEGESVKGKLESLAAQFPMELIHVL